MTNINTVTKIGIIGRGKWGKKVIKVLKQNFKVEFIVGKDVNYKRLSKKIDWVFILTPNATHYKLCKFFLKSKINVFCEKPLTNSIKQANNLYKLSDQNKVNLYVDDIEIFKNKKIKIKNFNSIIRTKSDYGTNYSIFERLCYHDLYILYKYIKNKKLKKITFLKNKDLVFRLNYKNATFNFFYSINSKTKIHKINNNNFLKFKENPLKKMILDLKKRKKFNENRKRSLFALSLMLKLKLKYKKR